ncbi:LysR family transcriptional regulator [Salinifilum aidingensis]
MELAALESFLAVLETGTVTEAARRRFTSQPALSRQIRTLEDTCGTQLFTRAKTGMVPTRAGRQLEPVARDLLARSRSAERMMSTLAQQEVPLTVACPTMVAEHLVLPFVAERCAAVANVLERPTLEIFDLVTDLSADLGIAPITPPPGIESRLICHIPFSVQVTPDSPLAGRAAVDITELPELPLLVPDALSGTRRAFDAHLARADVTLHPRTEVTRTHIAQAMATAGQGVVVAIDPPQYDLVAVPLLSGGRQLFVEEWAGWPSGHYAAGTIRNFLDAYVAWLRRSPRAESLVHAEHGPAAGTPGRGERAGPGAEA